MSVTIQSFSTWASQNQQAAVAVKSGATGIVGLEDESNQAGRLSRFFGFGRASQVRGTAMAEFTRALSARYGASIARQALSSAGLSATSKLKGVAITRVINAAKSLRAAMLTSTGGSDLRLGNTSITQAQVGGFGADGQKLVQKFLRQRAVAVELLGEIPLSQADYADFKVRCGDIMKRLVGLKCRDIPAGIPADEFKEEVNSLLVALVDKSDQARELIEGMPLGATGMQDYQDLWREAAMAALKTLATAATAGNNAAAATAIMRAVDRLCDDPQTIAGFNDRAKLSKSVVKNVSSFVADLANQELRQANVRGFKVDSDDVAREMQEGMVSVSNRRQWPVISKTVSASVNNRAVRLTSTIAAAEQLGHSQQSPRGPIADGYPQDIHGYVSQSSKADHAVNLAVSSLSVGEPDGAQQLAFCGVRHGVHCAWGIAPGPQRVAANIRRAEEAVIAAFLAKYSVQAPNQPLPPVGQDHRVTVDLKMTSVSLLTPDTMRNYWKSGSGSDERMMLMEQNAAWDSVMQNGVSFQYNGMDFHVRPQILKFNFGVNEGAVNWSWLASNKAGGWDLSTGMNGVAFATLSQEVDAFVQSHPNDPKAAVARTLRDQCKSVLDVQGERYDSHDAYKVAARIAVLAQLIGSVSCWNCKSGKDRTGEMDVECKFLSTLIARNEPIPAPGAALSEAQKGLFRSIALNGGNFEIQKRNAGVGGFKTGKVQSITERLGGDQYREFHRGGSSHVEA